MENALLKAVNLPEIGENVVVVTNLRHYDVLTKAHHSINRVIRGFGEYFPEFLYREIIADYQRLATIIMVIFKDIHFLYRQVTPDYQNGNE